MTPLPSHLRAGAPSRLRRGTCPACGRSVALRKGGLTREHRSLQMSDRKCPGTGRTHVELQRALEHAGIHGNGPLFPGNS